MNPRTRRSSAALVRVSGPGLLTAVLTALLTAPLIGLLPVGALPTARAAEPAPAPASVSVLPPFPLLAVPGTPVRVRAGVRDTGGAVLRDVNVRLRVVPERLSTRDQLSRWLSGEDAREGQAVGTPVPLHGPLTPGAGASVDVEVPGAALGLAGRPFGAYGLVVEVRANVDGVVRRVALTRTAVPWQARKEYRPQQLAWLVPFTGLPGASSPDEPGPVEVAAAVGPGSRLRHVLDAASAPGVTWAVDPALLTTLERVAGGGVVTSTPTASPSTSGSTSAPSAAVEQSRAVVRGYLADLRAAAAGREVLELSYADPDVRALTRARAGDLARAARTAAPGVVQHVLGVPARSDVGWPADGYAGNSDLPTWGAMGATALVLDPRSRPLADVPGYTVDARVALPRSMTALMLDPSLSGLLGSVRSTDASAAAAFLAHTAVATSELAGTVRRLLVAAPRNIDPDPAAFRSLVASAGAVPWLEPAQVSGLLQPLPRSSTADLPRRTVPAPDGPAMRGVGQRDITVVRALRRQLAAVNEVVDVPATSTTQAQRTTLELLSVAWRGHHGALVARQRALADSAGSRVAGVRVLPSTINFLANDGRLQVTVANGLNQRVQGVRLEVTVPSPKLQVVQPRSAPLTLEAGQRTGVRVPVRALASGLVTLQARLITPSGAQIGVPQELQVRLRPTDSWLVMAFGGVVGLALVFGLVRSLRRPRRRVEATAPFPQESR